MKTATGVLRQTEDVSFESEASHVDRAKLGLSTAWVLLGSPLIGKLPSADCIPRSSNNFEHFQDDVRYGHHDPLNDRTHPTLCQAVLQAAAEDSPQGEPLYWRDQRPRQGRTNSGIT